MIDVVPVSIRSEPGPVELCRVTKTFGPRTAVDEVSFALDRGVVTGAVHINRCDQAIGDPQRVVTKVLESAAERAQTGGAADSGP